MAKANLLDTKTVNLAELIGNGKQFEVPPFQRDYSWGEEQWEDLWSDILGLRDDSAERHYMGSLVVEAMGERSFRIIDGQQRIATLSVFALAVIARLHELADGGVEESDNRERAATLRNTFIGQKDPVSLTESSKLKLNVNDGNFYQDNLVALRPPQNPRALPRSNALLWECWNWFRERLRSDAGLRSGRELAALLNDVVAMRLLFIQITVDDEMNAYTVFETLNARGLELSATDLLKNYLFSRIASRADLEALERRWRRLIATVRQERFPDFLRYHLLCQYSKIRQQRLFKLIRGEVKQPKEVFSLIDALESRAELYSAISDVNHGYWLDLPEARPYVRELKLFGVRQMTPLVFAAWEKLDKKDFVSVLRMLTVFAFRYTVIGGKNTNELEPAYHEAASAVLAGKANGPAQVFEVLRPIYITDEKFASDFAVAMKSTRGSAKRVVKYILCRLEGDLRESPVFDELEPASIEHILPENPGPGWEESISRKEWDSAVYRLGNLTLLEPNFNREVGNSEFGNKVQLYAQSTYRISQEVEQLSPDEWTVARMEDRQRRMARRAVKLWRVDY